ERDTFHDDLVFSNARVFADNGRLHDALAVDDRAQPARPRGIDERVGDSAAIERSVITAVEDAIVGDDHADWRVKLAEAAEHPILAAFLVVARNAHSGEQLLGDADLPLAMNAGERRPGAKFPRLRHAR